MATEWTSRSAPSRVVVVDLDGEIDAARRDEVVSACLRAEGDVVVDMSSVTLVDSRGYEALNDARRAVVRRGSDCVLVNVTPTVRRHLALIERAASVAQPN